MMEDFPKKQGLYDPQFEHDSCGVGFVAHIKGEASHQIIDDAIQLLVNLKHRGALGADPETGDGSGISVQIPHRFFQQECKTLGFKLPKAGEYGVAMAFLPADPERFEYCAAHVESVIVEKGLAILGWRDVPTDSRYVGKTAAKIQPRICQIFIGKGRQKLKTLEFERLLYVIRKAIRNSIKESRYYMVSLSSQNIIYKGMLHSAQLHPFFPDLSHPDFCSAIAIVHSRFSTNTFPSWRLAQPFRRLAHNGEINTLRGNVNWMQARQRKLASPLYENIREIFPIILPRGSDSACLDNALEFLSLSGYSLTHAMLLLVPEAWQNNEYLTPEKQAFYEYYEHLVEPWDGPAVLTFTDGKQVGAVLDRNGLRPARYVLTKDNRVILASEVGATSVPPEMVKAKGRLRPGRLFVVDTEAGRIIDDDEIKTELCQQHPYSAWLQQYMMPLNQCPLPPKVHGTNLETLLERQKIFGYTTEELSYLLKPMAENGAEATGSMGNDAALAVLSDRPQLLYNYFKQLFAQVTNPPIDSIREEMVMSLVSHLGKERNILEHTPEHAHLLRLEYPFLTNVQLEQIRALNHPSFSSATVSTLFKKQEGVKGLEQALKALCQKVVKEVKAGKVLLVLSDRGVDSEHVPIPALLAVAAVHHHLIQRGLRTSGGIILETGEAREVAHFALLLGYGVGAINPYLVFESFDSMIQNQQLDPELTLEQAAENYFKALKKGLFKIFSKMGISAVQSYRGAQIFEAVGLSEEVVRHYFTGTPSRLGGIGLKEIAKESLMRHHQAYHPSKEMEHTLEVGGAYSWKRRGEFHQIHPQTVQELQAASQQNSREAYQRFANLLNDPKNNRSTLRSLLRFKKRKAVPLEEVESAESIVTRFATGAMSFGSISMETHQSLAIAMNRIGGKSNSGEGGEDPKRFQPYENGDWANSAIKQVASGRFGVTIHYLVNCNELQIKIAQGAKPGEGGQLPGKKVSAEIAKVRHSTPGVTLISPPPHHDIYSIEDLSQLIFDLKNANPQARITVKLVAEAGVGTIAAGVAKAHADMIVIAGHDGGTGASPLTSVKHAGVPWELGLSETHQTLRLNGLRGRVRLQTDGQLKTGRDVVIAAMLGAEEFGFATAPLITLGCIMMRKCHLNTCPVGIATQNPALRKKFEGKPEYVVNYFFMVAEEIREWMAQLGFRRFNEMVGRSDCLEMNPKIDHWKAKTLDLSALLHQPDVSEDIPHYCIEKQQHELATQLDNELIQRTQTALNHKLPIALDYPICNTDRTVGTMLSSEIARKYGHEGLPEDTIQCHFRGSAGQSFGAFAARGLMLSLRGDANDYVGKGLSGGRISIRPPKKHSFAPEDNIIIGNTALYGATEGEAFINGRAGERFAVRNSGATAVIEGLGDHGCEYMTGGVVVVLGSTGRNFAAGMSGGIAYVLDEHQHFSHCCNFQMVELYPVDNPKEQEQLKQLLERHFEYTQSPKAQRLLDRWKTSLAQFVKVFPIEYRMALEKNA